MWPKSTPATRWTRSCSTIFRSLVSATSGRPWLSSTISSTLRPAICEPISSRYIVMPLTMSLAACAAGPVRSVMNPILIGPDWAGVPPTVPRNAIRTSNAIARLRGLMVVPPEGSVGPMIHATSAVAGPAGGSGTCYDPDRHDPCAPPASVRDRGPAGGRRRWMRGTRHARGRHHRVGGPDGAGAALRAGRAGSGGVWGERRLPDRGSHDVLSHSVPRRLPQPARSGVREPPRTARRHAVAAGARGDTILIERYQYGRNDRHRFTSWSMAKTVTSMLVGIAIAEGRIRSVDDQAAAYVPGLADTEYGRTSLRHLLQMSSGVRFVENYSGRDDVARLAADTFLQTGPGGVEAVTPFNERAVPAGTKFSYASVETQVLGLVLRNAVGRPVAEYLSEKIWRPMGAEADATWLVDRAGQESTYLLHQRRAARRCSAGIAAGSRRQLARPADHPGHLDRGGHARASGAGPSQAGRRDTVPRLWLPGLDRAGRAPDTRAPRRAWSDDPG